MSNRNDESLIDKQDLCRRRGKDIRVASHGVMSEVEFESVTCAECLHVAIKGSAC